MVKTKTTSLADQVFERLESDILSGVYPRNSIITELQLCEDLGVSRTPIREALNRLEQEHIIEATGKGMQVLSITMEDAKAMYRIRLEVEILAVRSCIQHITEEKLQELHDLVELQEFYSAKSNSEQLKITDGRFHSLIYSCCDTNVYADTLQPLLMKLQKVRKNSFEDHDRAVSSVAEHRMILAAIEAKNEEAAVGAMRLHISNASSHVEKRGTL